MHNATDNTNNNHNSIIVTLQHDVEARQTGD